MFEKPEGVVDRGDNFASPSLARNIRGLLLANVLIAVVASVLTTLVIESAMGNLRKRSAPEVDGALGVLIKDDVMVQKGEENCSTSGDHEVYYPAPFPSRPNLSFPDGDSPSITEQRKDGFKYRTYSAPMKFPWRAVGLRPLPSTREGQGTVTTTVLEVQAAAKN